MTTFNELMYGISIQETGGHGKGDYSKVNSYGAVGKYQVLKSNIPGWSKQVLGYSISWQKFRDSPDLQEKIVRGILKGYYDKWGARGAAAAWYAGPGNHNLDMSTRSQPGGPSIKGYVDGVLGHAKGYTGKDSGGGGSSSPSKGELAENYGFVIGLLNSNKELRDKFEEARKGGWDAAKFQAELRDTKWWKTHSQSEREFLVLKYGDPKTADAKLDASYTHVRQLANQLGIVETGENKDRLHTWAYKAAALGWSDDQLRYEIGKYVSFKNDTWQGEGGEHMEKLHEYAYNMGVKMSADWYADRARNIVRGIATEQDYESEIRKQAKAMFPQWSKQLDAGQSLMDLASPYMQSMAQILEVPGSSLNLFDPTIKKAMEYKDPASGSTTGKPLWQFENDLRADPRWKGTQNAQNGMMQMAHQVLADFGFKT